ncbi:cytochrome c biogenesis protein ResB [Sesbania bispinosa]|nr:cytochrome c biogenesis protein ResB [Sesbania bispinosa]
MDGMESKMLDSGGEGLGITLTVLGLFFLSLFYFDMECCADGDWVWLEDGVWGEGLQGGMAMAFGILRF